MAVATQALMNFEDQPKTYTGPTVLAAGRNRMTPSASPLNSSSFTISNDAQFEPFGDGIYNLGAGTLFLNSNGTGVGASGVIRPSREASKGYYVTIPNPIVLQSTSLIHSQTVSVTPGPTLGSITGFIKLSGVISGTGKLQLTAPSHNEQLGTYYLEASNTYSGGTELYGGKLVVGDESGGFPGARLGTGNVTIFAGSLTNGTARGFLEIDAGVTNAIADAATLSLAGGVTGGVADDGYVYLAATINEKVGGLILGGVHKRSKVPTAAPPAARPSRTTSILMAMALLLWTSLEVARRSAPRQFPNPRPLRGWDVGVARGRSQTSAIRQTTSTHDSSRIQPHER